MKKLLWLDDFRNPKDYLTEDYDIVWVKSYEEFCSHLENNGLPDIVCFDHDLGTEKSGLDCARYLVNYCQQHNLDIQLNYGAFPDRPYDSPCTYGDNTKINQIMHNA